MRRIVAVHIDTETNMVSVTEAYGERFEWDLNTETLPQYINNFIKNAKVEVLGNLVTYRQ